MITYYRLFFSAKLHALKFDDKYHTVYLQKMQCGCGKQKYGFVIRQNSTQDIVEQIIECQTCYHRTMAETNLRMFLTGMPIKSWEFLHLIRYSGIRLRRSTWNYFFNGIIWLCSDGMNVKIGYANAPFKIRRCSQTILKIWKKLYKQALAGRP